MSPSLAEVSDSVRKQDATALADMLQRNGIFVSTESERRLGALLADHLINDAEMKRILDEADPEALDSMFDRVEQNDRAALRASRATSFMTITNDFDLRAAGLSFKEVEELETLVQEGLVDSRDVISALKRGNVATLRDEIERRTNDREHELELTRGRSL